MTPEGRIKTKLRRRLDVELGVDCWAFMPVQTGYGRAALDYILCVKGHYVSIETKRDNKAKLTPRQEIIREGIEAAGGLVLLVCDDESLDRAIRQLKRLR